ncbi:MAG: hypothetical protein JNM63_14625, partial [Spirochaetia bacterium]|nr:hypothetical protein [Spirochaetia bacterium]
MPRSDLKRFIFGCFLSAGFLFAAPTGILKDLGFYASFNQGAEPEYALGAPVFKPKEKNNFQIVFAPGKSGKGLRVDTNILASPIQYFASGNVDPAVGTISFWIKPSEDRGLFQIFNCEGLIVQAKENRIYFWTYSGDWKNRSDSYEPAANGTFYQD